MLFSGFIFCFKPSLKPLEEKELFLLWFALNPPLVQSILSVLFSFFTNLLKGEFYSIKLGLVCFLILYFVLSFNFLQQLNFLAFHHLAMLSTNIFTNPSLTSFFPTTPFDFSLATNFFLNSSNRYFFLSSSGDNTTFSLDNFLCRFISSELSSWGLLSFLSLEIGVMFVLLFCPIFWDEFCYVGGG